MNCTSGQRTIRDELAAVSRKVGRESSARLDSSARSKPESDQHEEEWPPFRLRLEASRHQRPSRARCDRLLLQQVSSFPLSGTSAMSSLRQPCPRPISCLYFY